MGSRPLRKSRLVQEGESLKVKPFQHSQIISILSGQFSLQLPPHLNKHGSLLHSLEVGTFTSTGSAVLRKAEPHSKSPQDSVFAFSILCLFALSHPVNRAILHSSPHKTSQLKPGCLNVRDGGDGITILQTDDVFQQRWPRHPTRKAIRDKERIDRDNTRSQSKHAQEMLSA
ncbi:hypothetical protein Q8A67_010917 [Cirrhinus molitorella]|uniref:Uncharacterized protein n=1 Tax=Cirrhinus molitorella TaxID=172907 RepID=A0AA88PQ83_9TELE|nr:hypothetical protein Q8A67_010917 [Cirrhinus molitorella]